MNSRVIKVVFAALMAVLFVLCQQSTFAQKNQGKMNQMRRDSTHQHQMMMNHPMGEQNMSEVRSEIQKTDRSAGTAISEIRSARDSNDPKVMKSALDKVEKQLTEIQTNMANAIRMINNPQSNTRMQGGSKKGGMMQGKGMYLDRQGNNIIDSTRKQK